MSDLRGKRDGGPLCHHEAVRVVERIVLGLGRGAVASRIEAWQLLAEQKKRVWIPILMGGERGGGATWMALQVELIHSERGDGLGDGLRKREEAGGREAEWDVERWLSEVAR